jgi:hypothetical protein
MLARTRKLALASALSPLLAALALLAAAPASAQQGGAWWLTDSGASPSRLQPGKEGRIWITAIDQGWRPVATTSRPVVVEDTLPPGIELAGTAQLFMTSTGGPRSNGVDCEALGAKVTCSLTKGTVFASQGVEVVIPVKVPASAASGETLANRVEVSGGTVEGGPEEVPSPAPQEHAIAISSAPTSFGIERYELVPENDEGGEETQAGAHPFQLTTTLDLRDTQVSDDVVSPPLVVESTPAPVRNLHFTLPPGLVGDVNSLKQCTAVQFNTIYNGDSNGCPASTAVGVANIKLYEPQHFSTKVETVPVFNLVPAPGEPARFGIEFAKVTVPLTTRVKTGSSYAVEVSAEDTSQSAAVIDSQVTFWGVPGDPRHNSSRGWECLAQARYEFALEHPHPCPETAESPSSAFLSLPTLCTPLETSVTAQSWPFGPRLEEAAGGEATYTSPSALTGCEALSEQFAPALTVEPETTAASTPSGLLVGITVPQAGTETAGELAEAAVSATTLALPAGLEASPGAANGLTACGIGEIGLLPGLPEASQLENDHFTPNEATCAPGSKLGTVKIETPLLPEPLEGGFYLASQDTNLVEERLVSYIVAKNPVSGVLVKLAGEVHVDPGTGQLTSVFRGTPPVPFSKLTISLFGGGRAAQSTPPLCGTYTPTAAFVPSSGGSKSASTTFEINSGPGGSPCPGATRPLAPSFTAGSTNKQAGAFTGFTLTVLNADADQRLTGLSTTLPAGVAALLSTVTACAEPPPGAPWECGADSLLGNATTSSGFGGEPFTLSGKVYLTAGYDGAPFGLLVATDAVAGPFDLGMVYVRSRINVNPETAAVTVTTDPGPHGDSFPTRLRGLPVQLKQLTATIDRPNFQFNGTNCDPLSVGGTLFGSEGGVAPVSAPFQLSGCSALPFAPKLTASTTGHGSRVNGTNFNVKLESAGVGQANIHKVFLTIPRELPSRLPTLQKACTEAKFDAGPQNCPSESVIGHATVHTPVLRSALTGPAYLVSHGNAGFPDVEFVLQGEGVRLVLDGKTDIKNGVTYSRFETAPDAPFTTFETELPAGPHSILAAFTSSGAADPYNICSRKLEMPTEITAQNGTVIRQTTKIKAMGCGGVASFKETRAQKLAKALKACRKKHNKAKRLACEKRARKLYGHRRTNRKPATKKH